MDASKTSEKLTTNIRPISRKYLRYLLEALNDNDSGRGIFARLATRLIHRRKCANIIPATEPSSSGDLGQDARTHKVLLESNNIFRLYSSPPEVKERWIFAFSIDKKWKSKLSSDVKKIINNKLNPERIIYVTNQFISPEKTKIKAEQEITNRHGVECEILDGQWILDQLYDFDYFLAVEFLDCPPEEDPQLLAMFRRLFGLKETGLSEQEAYELEQLKEQVQYRNKYTDNLTHLVQDLERIGNILSNYEAHIEEALKWYEEGLPLVDKLTYVEDGIELYYSYFKALFKLPSGGEQILKLLPLFIELVFKSKNTHIYRYIEIWLQFMIGRVGTENTDLINLLRKTRLQFDRIGTEKLGSVNVAHIDEIVIFLDTIIYRIDGKDVTPVFEELRQFLNRLKIIEFYPIARVAQSLSAIAVWLSGDNLYEECFELALELESKQYGGFQKAQTLAIRAVNHAEAGQYTDAIQIALRAKKLLFTEDSLRRFLITSIVLSEWYREIKFFAAAEYELYEAIFVANATSASKEQDLFIASLLELATISLLQGKLLRAYSYLHYYYLLCADFRIEPAKQVYERYLRDNPITLLANLFASKRPYHNRLLSILRKFGSIESIEAYDEIVLSSEEKFEVFLDGMSNEQRKEVEQLRLRVQQSSYVPIPEIQDYDELDKEQLYKFSIPIPNHDFLEITIKYSRDVDLESFAFVLASMFQMWFVITVDHVKKLTFADNIILINIERALESNMKASITSDDILNLNIGVSAESIEKLKEQEFDEMGEFFVAVATSIIDDAVIDPPDDLRPMNELLGYVLERHRLVCPPALLLIKNPFVRSVLETVYAS